MASNHRFSLKHKETSPIFQGMFVLKVWPHDLLRRIAAVHQQGMPGRKGRIVRGQE